MTRTMTDDLDQDQPNQPRVAGRDRYGLPRASRVTKKQADKAKARRLTAAANLLSGRSNLHVEVGGAGPYADPVTVERAHPTVLHGFDPAEVKKAPATIRINPEKLAGGGDKVVQWALDKAKFYTGLAEVQHGTPYDVRREAIGANDPQLFAGIVNVLEQARTQRALRGDLPGTAPYLDFLGAEFATAAQESNLMDLAYRARFGSYLHHGDYWSPYEADVSQALEADSTQAVIEAAKRITNKLVPEPVKNPQMGQPNMGKTPEQDPDQAADQDPTPSEPGQSEEDESEGDDEDGDQGQDNQGKNEPDEDGQDEDDREESDPTGDQDGPDAEGEPGNQDGGAQDQKGNGSPSDQEPQEDGDSPQGGNSPGQDGAEGPEQDADPDPSDDAQQDDSAAEPGGQGAGTGHGNANLNEAPAEGAEPTRTDVGPSTKEAIQAAALAALRDELEAELDAIQEEVRNPPKEHQGLVDAWEEGMANRLGQVIDSIRVDACRTRIQPSRRHGLLDSHRLTNVFTGDSFLKQVQKSKGFDFAVSLLIDVSGSMFWHRILPTLKAARCINSALDKAEVPSHVILFDGGHEGSSRVPLWHREYAYNDDPDFNPGKWGGGTQFDAPLRAAKDWAEKQNVSRRLVLILTDGQPHDSIEDLAAQKAAIDAIGGRVVSVHLGMSKDQVTESVVQAYAHEAHFVRNLEDLAQVTEDLLLSFAISY